MSTSLSSSCKRLIEGHLDPNPSTRFNMNDILAHEWFEGKSGHDDQDDDD